MGIKSEVVALVGCTKFKEEFLIAARELTLQAFLVLPPNVYNETDKMKISYADRIMLSALQESRIDASDSVYVINKDGYIDEETSKAIDYAKSTGKKVFYAYVQCDCDCKYAGCHFCPARTISALLKTIKVREVLPGCGFCEEEVK